MRVAAETSDSNRMNGRRLMANGIAGNNRRMEQSPHAPDDVSARVVVLRTC
jgi:hypothetical protein